MSQHEIISPLPGTFYRKPTPDAPPFAEVGQNIGAGDVIGLIEVMKQYSELSSEVAGTVVALLIEDGDIVEPGQVVAIIETGV